MVRSKHALALSCLFLVAASAASAAEPKVVAQQIPGVYTAEGTGAYDQVYAAVAKEVPGLPKKPEVVPAGRAIAMFAMKEADCQTPANSNKSFYPVDFPTVQSAPFNVAKVYAFGKPGTQPVASLGELKGKKVAVRQGFNYGADFDAAGLQLEKGVSIEANVRKLLDNRVDVVVDFVPDAWDAFANLKMAPLPHAADKPLAIHQDAILCRDTPENRALIGKVDAALGKLKAAGELQKILGSAYIPE